MSFDIHDLGPDTTVAALCARLGEMLELDHPLPEPVARAAVTRPDYARYLWAARGQPALLDHLIRSAPPPGKSNARFTETPRPRPAPTGDLAPALVEPAGDLAAGNVAAAEPAASEAAALEPAASEAPEEAASPPSSASLVFEASRSLLRWAAGSFRVVDDAQYERRISACSGCEHQRAPRGNLVHDVLRAVDPASKVCGLCGCLTAKKARLPHESCPASDPDDPTRTRWGEPRRSG